MFPNIPDVLDINNSNIIKDMNKYDLDFAGWDINKTLFQISKGNPDLISWFYSPIVYGEHPSAQIVRSYTVDFFKPISAYYHYLHMAKRNYNQYIKNPEGDLVNTKKYLYVLRPILACKWIELVKSIPPMKFEDIYEKAIIKSSIGSRVYDEIKSLVFTKMHQFEMDNQPRNAILDTFIEHQIVKYESMPKEVDFEVKTYDNLEKTFKQFAKGEL